MSEVHAFLANNGPRVLGEERYHVFMIITETEPDSGRRELLAAVAGDAADLLGIGPGSNSPQAVMQLVDTAIVDLVFGRPTPVAEDENPDLLLGCLWGEQLVRQFDWYWTDVVVDNEFNEVAVIAPQQEMIVFPLSFAAACIHKQCVCTVLLAFNMLLEGRLDDASPGSYTNIMLSIHHIVPPYRLEPEA